MAPLQKHKSSDLIEKINNLSPEDRKNAILMRSLENDTKGIIHKDPQTAFTILGMLACFRYSIPDMHKYHKQAIAYPPKEFFGIFNYATSLSKCGFFLESLKYAQLAYDIAPTDKPVIGLSIVCCSITGRFQEAFSWVERWNKLSPETPHSAEPFCRTAVGFLEKNQIPENEISKLLNIAFPLLSQQDIYNANYFFRVSRDDESQWLSYEVEVQKTVNEVVDLNMELAERLAEETFHPLLTDIVSVGYITG